MDADAYPQEVLTDEEPKYLRRQKPLEIKRRKFGKKAWKGYLRALFWTGTAAIGAGTAYLVGHFLLASKEMALLRPEQIQIEQNHYVTPASVRDIFRVDRGHSVLRVPLSERRRQVETLPWVERATVMRVLPNTVKVEITERTPVAFLRQGSDMALVDAHGVILDRPMKGNFHFPVVSGFGPDMPLEDRGQRMQLFSSFTQQVEAARPGALEQVSDVDLTEAKDLSARITGVQVTSSTGGASTGDQWGNMDAPIVVHFGDSDFENKFLTVLNDISQWRMQAGRVESVDLRFNGEAVVNPDSTLLAKKIGPANAAPNDEPAINPESAAASGKPAPTSRPADSGATSKPTPTHKKRSSSKAKSKPVHTQAKSAKKSVTKHPHATSQKQ
jgi:cell division protein FtsQ